MIRTQYERDGDGVVVCVADSANEIMKMRERLAELELTGKRDSATFVYVPLTVAMFSGLGPELGLQMMGRTCVLQVNCCDGICLAEWAERLESE